VRPLGYEPKGLLAAAMMAALLWMSISCWSLSFGIAAMRPRMTIKALEWTGSPDQERGHYTKRQNSYANGQPTSSARDCFPDRARKFNERIGLLSPVESVIHLSDMTTYRPLGRVDAGSGWNYFLPAHGTMPFMRRYSTICP